MPTQDVIIRFISDTSQLEPGLDRLEGVEKETKAAFQSTNAEVNKQVGILKNIIAQGDALGRTGKITKASIVDLAKSVKSMGDAFRKEFLQGAKQALDEAGVSVEEFEGALESALVTTEKSAKSLKVQLREMTAELVRMKVAGEDDSEAYRKLAQEAGNLKDAIADANQEVKNFGSDTSTFDGLISLTQGAAGGFAVVQGAAALFGDESEELQKTLLRVNAAMAILQGLQQVQTVLQKESAAATLLNTIATRAQTIAQVAFNFVVGTSTGLLKAFRIALAATGVGLLIIGLIELVKALNSTDDSLERANETLENQQRLLESTNGLIQQRTDLEVARLRASEAAESDIIRATGRSLQAQRKALEFANQTLAAQRDALDSTSEAWFKLNAEIEKNNDTIRSIDNQTVIKGIELQGQLAREEADRRKKAIEDAKAASEKAKELARAQREAEFADFKAGIELRLLAAEKGSQEELDLRKRLALASLQIELDNQKLTQNQRKLLIQQFFKDRIDLEKNFNKEQTRIFRENTIAEANTALQQLEISMSDRLIATEAAINEQASIEVEAAEGNAVKIREINARRDKAIRDARIASIQEAVNYEIALATATNGPEQRRLAATAANNKATLQERISAIDTIANLEADAIGKRIEALNKEREQGLISQRDYNLQYAQLQDDQTKVYEDAEKKKTDITLAENEKRKQANIKLVQDIVSAATEVVGVLSSLYDLQSTKENNRITEQKENLKALQEAGAITEKEAFTRAKRLEAEEKRIRQQQAQRDKQIAVFNALLAIPTAYLRGLSQGGLPLAIIYGAIAAVQAGIVAARPIPKFGKGKKNKYQGIAQVGETGPELIEQNGRMFVADKPQILWLNRDDKVFNPKETMDMLAGSKMTTYRGDAMGKSSTSVHFDYEKMGEEVGKHVQTNVYVDGVLETQVKKKQFTQWLNNRRAW